MRWPAWLRRGEPPPPEVDEELDPPPAVRPEEPPAEEGVLGWWFAGGPYAGGDDPPVGTTQTEAAAPEPGRRGLHASPSVIAALAHAHTGAPPPRAPRRDDRQRRRSARGDLAHHPRERRRERAAARAGAAVDRSRAGRGHGGGRSARPGEHRRRAQVARERALEAEERLRDAEWVLEEGAGRAGGAARARALGEREGARRAVEEARAAAYAHEAAAHLAEGADIRATSRAVELVIEALAAVERGPDPHASVRGRLDREIEEALAASLRAARDAARSARPASDVVEPVPSPHRGQALLHAIERALAPHTGARGVHPLALDHLAHAHVSLALRCDSRATAERAVAAIDESPELGVLRVRAIAEWGSLPRAIVSRALAQELGDDERLGPGALAAVRHALDHPALDRGRDALLRAWLVREPEVAGAAWLPGGVLSIRVDGSVDRARELLARLASHYPGACASVAVSAKQRAWLVTDPALHVDGALDDAEREAPLVYTRSCGLFDPVRALAQAPRGARAKERSAPRALAASVAHGVESLLRLTVGPATWVEAVGEICAGTSALEGGAWALGGDEALAAHLSARGVMPVVVVGVTDADVHQIVHRADRSDALDRFGVGVVGLPVWHTTSTRRADVVLDDRLSRVLGEEHVRRLVQLARDRRPQPLVFPPPSERELRDMLLRWQLARLEAVEAASWVYGAFAEEDVLAVQVRDRGVVLDVEAAVARAFGEVTIAQVSVGDDDAICFERLWPGTRWGRPLEHDLSALRGAVPDALADPDVYARAWMLAAPPDPVRRPAGQAPHPVTRRDAWAPSQVGSPTARCPRCDFAYYLPLDTPLEQTRCGFCDNPCLIPARESRAPYVAPRPSRTGCAVRRAAAR
ncbi:MAG: hypothetical protein M5U28_06080 [Sandaracinaceae bacterium]|nr:hypothetical protein [Sandaracinaceae bacterium]